MICYSTVNSIIICPVCPIKFGYSIETGSKPFIQWDCSNLQLLLPVSVEMIDSESSIDEDGLYIGIP